VSAVGTRGNCGKVSNNGLLESGWLVGDAPGLRYHLVPCIRAGKTLETSDNGTIGIGGVPEANSCGAYFREAADTMTVLPTNYLYKPEDVPTQSISKLKGCA